MPRALATTMRSWGSSFKKDPERVVILVAASTVAALGAANVIEDLQKLLAATLAILAVIGFTLFKESIRRQGEEAQRSRVLKNTVELVERSSSSGEALNKVVSKLDDMQARVAPISLVDELAKGEPVTQALTAELKSSSDWRFRGGTGSFTRLTTLPAIAKKARDEGLGVEHRVYVHIIDPQDEDLCEEYANYRKKLSYARSDGASARWSTSQVQLECLATILAAVWHSQREFLRIEVAFRSDFGVYRYDISETAVILTNEDRNQPALRVRGPGPLYRGFRAEIERDFKKSKRLSMEEASLLPDKMGLVNQQHVAYLMQELELDLDVLRKPEASRILTLAFGEV